MSSDLIIDMKLTVATIGELAKQNASDKNVLNSCQVVIDEIKKAIKSHGGDVKSQTNLEVTELFGLFRTRITLMLLKDVNLFDDSDPKIEESFTTILDLVEEKINQLKEGKEKSR